MVRLLPALVAVLAAALLALPAEAQWKWRDKTGRVQYSDLPPPSGTPEQDILGKPSVQQRRSGPIPVSVVPTAAVAGTAPVPAAASGALVPRTADPELEARRKKAEAEQATKLKVEEDRIAAARADNCARAKSQLATLESGMRLVRANDKGEREFLDDKQRADELKRSRDSIKSDCK
jgi:hypothetical protein